MLHPICHACGANITASPVHTTQGHALHPSCAVLLALRAPQPRTFRTAQIRRALRVLPRMDLESPRRSKKLFGMGLR